MSFDFFKELEGLKGGKVVKSIKTADFESYIDRARFQFDTNGKKQIALIQDGKAKGNWFEKLTDGSYKITFKNGIVPMELRKGFTYYFKANAEEACVFIAQAVLAAEDGQLDEHFTKTRRLKKAETEKNVNAVVEKVKTNGRMNVANGVHKAD